MGTFHMQRTVFMTQVHAFIQIHFLGHPRLLRFGVCKFHFNEKNEKGVSTHLTEAAVGTGRRVFLEPNWKRQEDRALMFRVLGTCRGVGLGPCRVFRGHCPPRVPLRAALAAESAKLLASGLCHQPLLPGTLWRACPRGEEAQLERQQPLGLPASSPGVTRNGAGGSPSAPAFLSRDGLRLLRNLIWSACCPPSPAPDSSPLYAGWRWLSAGEGDRGRCSWRKKRPPCLRDLGFLRLICPLSRQDEGTERTWTLGTD